MSRSCAASHGAQPHISTLPNTSHHGFARASGTIAGVASANSTYIGSTEARYGCRLNVSSSTSTVSGDASSTLMSSSAMFGASMP